MKILDFKEIDQKWQKYWEEQGTNKMPTDLKAGEKKFYILDMFPYPSGDGLHVGHPKGYIATDVYSRLKRMQGYHILHPMGFDAFGLPAEQYALKNHVHPRVAVEKNVARYEEQLQLLGLNYDWSRGINTTDPTYYKWTQWMFKQMYQQGLAYESNEPINWCPSCKTGLAKEDLDGNVCERCGTVVEKRKIRQWVVRITNYADRLLKDLDGLDWEPHIKELQRNWIGKSEGSEIAFKIVDAEKNNLPADKLTIFTTRADTLFGCTFMAISWELAKAWIENGWKTGEEVKKLIEKFNREQNDRGIDFDMNKLEKEGIDTGIKAINPATGEEVPIYIANYILSDYGTGAIMAVPAHDERDYEFAKKYNLEIKYVVVPGEIYRYENFPDKVVSTMVTFEIGKENVFIEYLEKKGESYTLNGYLVNSNTFSGSINYEAKVKITESVGGRMVSQYKLRDWVFARQRYWGEPFPIVFDENHKSYVVADSELPVRLPEVENYEPTDTGESPLANIRDWVEVSGFINESGEFESVSGSHSERENKTIDTYTNNFETYISNTIQEVSDDYKTELDFLVNNLKGKKVLEIGSASGRDAEYLKNNGVNIIASDIINSFSESLKEKAIPFLNIDPLLDDFYQEKYDGILAIASLLHCEKHNFKKIIQKINLALNEEGYLYLRLKTGVGELEEESKGGYRFFSFYNEAELKDILEKNGFAIEKISYLENKKWINVLAKKVKDLEIKKFSRETNTMPQWAGSSWYWLRYIDPENNEQFCQKDLEKIWDPVDFYVGGAEHATRHLIYARFWYKFLYDIGVVNYEEPFTKLKTVGLITAEDGRKMSKRYGNTINPDEIAVQYGADTLRTYEMFMGPFEKAIAWSTNGLLGISRFLDRVYNLADKLQSTFDIQEKDNSEIEQTINQTIKKVGEDIEEFKFNTAISQLMICLNTWEDNLKKGSQISKGTLKKYIQVLAPFAVHLSEEIWQEILGEKSSIHKSAWPQYDESKIASASVEIALQISGKFRGTFVSPADSSEEELKNLAQKTEIFKKYVPDPRQIKKIITVKNRLVNIVI